MVDVCTGNELYRCCHGYCDEHVYCCQSKDTERETILCMGLGVLTISSVGEKLLLEHEHRGRDDHVYGVRCTHQLSSGQAAGISNKQVFTTLLMAQAQLKFNFKKDPFPCLERILCQSYMCTSQWVLGG